MNKIKVISALLAALFILNINSDAQEGEPGGQLWYVWEAMVKPSMNDKYMEMSAKIVDHCKQHDFPYTFHVWASPVFHYLWYYPIDDVKDTEMINRAWMGMASNMDPEIVAAFFGSIDRYEERVLFDRFDLGYVPQNPRIEPAESGFVFRQVFHVFPGKNRELEEIFKEYNVLLKNRDFPERYDCATGILGYENPSYILFNYGKDAGDFWTNYEKVAAILGEDLNSFNLRISRLIRKSEAEMLWYVQPFSYQRDNL